MNNFIKVAAATAAFFITQGASADINNNPSSLGKYWDCLREEHGQAKKALLDLAETESHAISVCDHVLNKHIETLSLEEASISAENPTSDRPSFNAEQYKTESIEHARSLLESWN
ncbi:hypothetical protein [Pseudomonas putida]|uniref:hypothetical protein n=1 Tax=Pseudomonas putida TaxID=303 RepID=UPI00160242ED|nr:hypothetical protein [Pseudomonas putida]